MFTTHQDAAQTPRPARQSAAERGPDAVDIAIGKEIRARRKLAGISQERLAAPLGVSFQQVQKYERGANRVSGSMAYRISEVLDCHPGDLFPPREGSSGREAGDPIRGAAQALLERPGGAALLQQLANLSERELRGVGQMVAVLGGAGDA